MGVIRLSIDIFPLPWGEGAPQGRVRGSKPLLGNALSDSRTPHPSAFAPTFSLWEKGSLGVYYG